jgi:hypothetical protein
MLYLPYVRTTTYLGRKTAQTQRAITSRTAKINYCKSIPNIRC